MTVEVFYKDSSNLYKPFAVKFSFDICQLLKNKTKQYLLEKYAMNHLEKWTNVNHSCPFTVSFNNLLLKLYNFLFYRAICLHASSIWMRCLCRLCLSRITKLHLIFQVTSHRNTWVWFLFTSKCCRIITRTNGLNHVQSKLILLKICCITFNLLFTFIISCYCIMI